MAGENPRQHSSSRPQSEEGSRRQVNVLFPRRRQNTNSLVITRQAVDPGLDENEAELAILVAFKVICHGDRLVLVLFRMTKR